MFEHTTVFCGSAAETDVILLFTPSPIKMALLFAAEAIISRAYGYLALLTMEIFKEKQQIKCEIVLRDIILLLHVPYHLAN